jgi:hypothetical protein
MAHLTQDKDGKYYLADEWHIEDVQSVRPDLDDDQASGVLEAVADNHDANYGINWDVLTYWADELFPIAEEDESTSEE